VSNLDQVALDVIDYWEIDSLGCSKTQSKAKLQIAITQALQQQVKDLTEENENALKEILTLSGSITNYSMTILKLTEANEKLKHAGDIAAMHWSDAMSGFQSAELMEFREAIGQFKEYSDY